MTQDKEGRPGWKFPGGHVEDKEFLKSAAVREIQEEIGIVISIREIVTIEDFFNRKRPNEHNIRFFVLAEKQGGEIKLNAEEVSCYRWFSRNELNNLSRTEVYPAHWNALNRYLNQTRVSLEIEETDE